MNPVFSSQVAFGSILSLFLLMDFLLSEMGEREKSVPRACWEYVDCLGPTSPTRRNQRRTSEGEVAFETDSKACILGL